jgi:predicted transcriptional regulator
MPTRASEAEIKNRITTFVQELDSLVRKSALDALVSVLQNGEAPRRGRRPGRRAGPGRGRRSSASVEESAGTILSHVRSNDGQGIGAIAKETGIPLKDAKKAIAHLLDSGQIKKTGQRRGTRYHAGAGGARIAKVSARRGKRRGRRSKAA